MQAGRAEVRRAVHLIRERIVLVKSGNLSVEQKKLADEIYANTVKLEESLTVQKPTIKTEKEDGEEEKEKTISDKLKNALKMGGEKDEQENGMVTDCRARSGRHGVAACVFTARLACGRRRAWQGQPTA